ncbi:FAD-dependent oxidoreductase [Paraburkholderia sp.]|uniref:FAD-dependent oxidoreductase n=1 Tax=Paraburkholderia sp. TaxID=1926495 RepID=UPI003D6E9E01
MIRDTFDRIAGFCVASRSLCVPLLLFLARLWFGQVVLVHRVMEMATDGNAAHATAILRVPSAVEAATQGVLPLLLSVGLFTRPVAVILVMSMAVDASSPLAAGAIGARLALLAWVVVNGPGAFSVDHLLARGMASSPFGPLRMICQLYQWITRFVTPVMQLLIRAGLFLAITPLTALYASSLPFAMFGDATSALIRPQWWALVIEGALLLGAATRGAALVVALTIPLAGVAMSMDDRAAILLLLLLFAASGAGVLSIDQLLDLGLRRWLQRGQQDAQSALTHVVVVGGGFGGVAAVRGLRHTNCQITLIDQRNHQLFQPLLYQVATAALSPAEIAAPIRSLFRRQRNVRVRLGEVTGVDFAASEVLIDTLRVKFDRLVMATGARHSYFGRDDWASFAPGLKSVEDATSIRGRLLRAFEEAENAADEPARVAWLTFVIVGGGPTGIELAGAIAELARHGLGDEYRAIDPATARVILLQSGPRILPAFSAASSAAAEHSLRTLGVDVRLGARVTSIDGEGVDFGGQRIAARTVLWAAGVAASPAAEWLGVAADSSGRLCVDPDLSVPGRPGVFAIGDTALSTGWNGAAVPGLAPAAKQQGAYVARVIDASLRGRAVPPPFRYAHVGSLATIGRQAAVAEIGGMRLWGAPAWWFWGAAHIAFLVGGRNRMTVLLDWIWAFLTYQRSTRLITRSGRE